MKNLNDFFAQSSNPELFKKTWEAGGCDFEDVKERPHDYYAANTGAVPGMIYYADTVEFAKKNAAEIILALFQFEEECGQLSRPDVWEEIEFYNWLAWFAWEHMMSELIAYLEY